MNFEIVLIVAAVGLLAYNLGKWAFAKDDKSERTREAFIELAGTLREYGLKDVPDVLVKLAIKDYSGAAEIAKFYVKLVKGDPSAVAKHFDVVFDRVLEAKLKSPESVAYLKAKLADKEKAAS